MTQSNEPQKAERPSLSDTPDEPPHWLLEALDLVIRLLARLIVLGLGLLVLRVGWLLAWGDDKAREVALSSVERVEGHWQALLILLLPLFYLPIRRLIYRAKAFGDHPVTQEQPAGTGNTTPPGKGTQVEVEHTL